MKRLITLLLIFPALLLGVETTGANQPSPDGASEWHYHQIAPATGVVPVQPGITTPWTEHRLGTIVVPDLPPGASLDTHGLRVKRKWSQDVKVGAQNRSYSTHWGWEWNDCWSPVPAGAYGMVMFRDANRPPDAYYWQDHVFGMWSGSCGVYNWPSTQPAEPREYVKMDMGALEAAEAAGDQTVYVGWGYIPGKQPQVFSQDAVYWPFTYEPGQEVEVTLWTLWMDGEEWSGNRFYPVVYEWQQDIDLLMEWVEIPQ